MNSDALSIVTQAIKRRIESALRDKEATLRADVVHVGPLNDAAAKDARLVLFLYRASVNADLRNAEHRVVSPNPSTPVDVFENAIPLDLHFLLSTSSSNVNNSLEGLNDLGIAIQAVNDAPDLSGGALLSDTIHLSFESMTTEELGRIWALFPNVNYRMSVLLLATPVWIDPAQPKTAAHPVVSEEYAVSPFLEEVGNEP